MNRAKVPGLTTFKFPIQNILSVDGGAKVSGFIDKILDDILAQKTDNQQIKMTMKYIDRLGL